MITPHTDAARVRFPPPFVYLLMVLCGIALEAFVYSPAVRWEPGLRIASCLGAALAGIALMAGAWKRFQETGQDPKPWKPTPEIVVSGVYRYTRNPMYVSMALLQTAIGAGLANLWIVALVPLSLVGVYFIAVRHEEAYLTEKFGQPYLDYKRSVRRWI